MRVFLLCLVMFGWFTDLYHMVKVASRAVLVALCSPLAATLLGLLAIPSLVSLVATFVISSYIPSIHDVAVSKLASIIDSQSQYSNLLNIFWYSLALDYWLYLLDRSIDLIVFIVAFIPSFLTSLNIFNRIFHIRKIVWKTHN